MCRGQVSYSSLFVVSTYLIVFWIHPIFWKAFDFLLYVLYSYAVLFLSMDTESIVSNYGDVFKVDCCVRTLRFQLKKHFVDIHYTTHTVSLKYDFMDRKKNKETYTFQGEVSREKFFWCRAHSIFDPVRRFFILLLSNYWRTIYRSADEGRRARNKHI